MILIMCFILEKWNRYLNINHGTSSMSQLSKYLIFVSYFKAKVTFVNCDGIGKVSMGRQKTNGSWGFRLSGLKDEGIALKLAKVK